MDPRYNFKKWGRTYCRNFRGKWSPFFVKPYERVNGEPTKVVKEIEVFAFFAVECGWTKQEVENLTIKEIQNYQKFILEQKSKKLRNNAILISTSVAYGSGNIKYEEFETFLNSISKEEIIPSKDIIKEVKIAGIEIEEK